MPARRRANATTAMNRPRRAAMRTAHVAERRGAGVPHAQDRHRGLHQQPAHAPMAGLGDPPSALALARAPLAGHQAQVGLDLMGAREAPGVVERGHERGGRDRPDAGDGPQPLHACVRTRDGRDPLVRVRELLIDLAHDGEQRGELREQAAGQGQGEDPANEPLRTAGRHAPAVLPEQGADHADVARCGCAPRRRAPSSARAHGAGHRRADGPGGTPPAGRPRPAPAHRADRS